MLIQIISIKYSCIVFLATKDNKLLDILLIEWVPDQNRDFRICKPRLELKYSSLINSFQPRLKTGKQNVLCDACAKWMRVKRSASSGGEGAHGRHGGAWPWPGRTTIYAMVPPCLPSAPPQPTYKTQSPPPTTVFSLSHFFFLDIPQSLSFSTSCWLLSVVLVRRPCWLCVLTWQVSASAFCFLQTGRWGVKFS